MSNKRKQRNGFFYFMLDMKEELRRQGRNVPMAQMSALAGPRWSNLSDAEKAAYNLRAKHEKRTISTTGSVSSHHQSTGKMDCMGELLSERRDLAAELDEKRRRQKEDLKSCLPTGRDVILQKFYFLDIQPLCELKELKKERWLPCEVAVVEFSLACGIHRSIHQFIHPGPIPMGYRYEAQSQSERTHMIPVDGFELANKDYRQILSELQNFICCSPAGASPVSHLIFAKRDNSECVEFLLNWLANKAGVECFINQVYEIESLLIQLDSIASSSGPNLTTFQASELFNTSAYDYERGTRCGWHEQREIKFCSLSTVKIYSFVMADHLCSKFQVSITPAHLPELPEQPAGIVIPPVVPRIHTPSSGVAQVTSGIQSISIGRGRGRGLSSLPQEIRQPKMVGRGMN